jgi:hypothetical protein
MGIGPEGVDARQRQRGGGQISSTEARLAGLRSDWLGQGQISQTLEGVGNMDVHTDGRTDGRMDRRNEHPYVMR